MAIKASATVTLSCYRDTESITRYYKLQSSTASAPSKPTVKPPSGWTDAEPSYTSGSTNTLYFCDLSVFSDGTWAYSTVSKSSSYEAAKEAYNKAVAAKDAADNAQEDIDNLEIGGRNLLLNSNNSNTWTMRSNNASTMPISVTDMTEGHRTFQRVRRINTSLSPTSFSLYNAISCSKITRQLKGRTFTMSYMVRCSRPASFKIWAYFVVNRSNTSMTGYKQASYMTIGTEWTKISVTGSIDCEFSDNDLLRFYPEETTITNGELDSFYIDICEYKIEFGNKATDWTPAPEDLASASDVSALTTRVANAELDIDSANAQIELRATKSEVTTLSNNLANNYYTKTQTDAQIKVSADSITSTVSSTYATKTALNTAQSTANSALSTAQKTAAVDYSGGKMLYTDPTFSNSVNSTSVYNNSGNGTVTVTRSAVSSDNPYKTSTSYELVITNTGNASPGCGGFNFSNASRANAVFVYRIVAKIPTGRNINWAANAFGTGSATTWLTPKAGTGAFTEYVIKIVCGSSGTFSSIGYFYIDGAVGTTDSPVTWYVAYATCYDMTNEADITTVANVANAANTTVETLSSSVEQLATSVTTSFTKKTEEITALQNSVNGLTNDISNVDKKVSNVTAWFNQSMDSSGNPVLELGTTANDLSMELSNSQLGFKDAGVLVAYINGKKMYITEAEITGQLKFGNYAWIPNGSHMTLKYLG